MAERTKRDMTLRVQSTGGQWRYLMRFRRSRLEAVKTYADYLLREQVEGARCAGIFSGGSFHPECIWVLGSGWQPYEIRGEAEL